MSGLSKFYREDHPRWALWVTRVVEYGCPAWYFDLHTEDLGNSWFIGCANRVAVIHRRASAVSEPGSEADGKSLQANNLYMSLPRRIDAISQSPRRDVECDSAQVHREGRAASRLPDAALREGLNLCRTHRGIYNTLGDQQVCSVMQCVRLGVAFPEG